MPAKSVQLVVTVDDDGTVIVTPPVGSPCIPRDIAALRSLCLSDVVPAYTPEAQGAAVSIGGVLQSIVKVLASGEEGAVK